jgi:hypothetical protein
MTTDNIKEIKIDDLGRLCIFPEKEKFSMIWRSATEVHWDNNNLFLFSPKPREWSYFNWYTQIIGAIKSEYGCDLLLTNDTLWINISVDLKQQILMYESPSIT